MEAPQTIETMPDFAALGDLTGRVALVVGAGQGIGGHTAHALRASGAQIVVVDIQQQLAEELASAVGGLAIRADITKVEEIERVLDLAVATYGRVDITVDIVGFSRFGALLDLTDEDWGESYDVNFRHVVLITRILGKYMARRGAGAIVFIGSISGIVSAGNHAAYGAFKSAVHSLVRSAAVEFGEFGVRVNAVAPGLTATPRVVAGLVDSSAIGRLGGLPRSQDIANAVVFLSSDRAAMITGQTLIVDAGQTLRYPIALPSRVVTGQAASGSSAEAADRDQED